MPEAVNGPEVTGMQTSSKTNTAHQACVHETAPIRVTYRDTDRMGHVYYANYLLWFEIGRTELLRGCGDSYREWEDKHGVFLPVSSCGVQYHRSAMYDDLIVVRTHVTRITKASIDFRYDVLRIPDRTLLATGSTRHALISRDGRIVRLADRLLPDLWANRPASNDSQEAG